MVAEEEPCSEAQRSRDDGTEEWHQDEEDDQRRDNRRNVHIRAPSNGWLGTLSR